MHGVICTGLLGACFLLLRAGCWWQLAAGLYVMNMGLVGAYMAVHHLTGAGFNEAALYYLISASWRDAFLLTAYPSLLFFGAVSAVLAFIFIKGVRRVRPRGILSMSNLSQMLLVLGVSAFSLYMTPLTADVIFSVKASGINKKDSVGLSQVLNENDMPEALPGLKKNLIILYVESLESAFFDQQLFPGLLPRLNELAEQGVRFDRIEQSEASGWTIAGMISTQCGVPLTSYRLDNQSHEFDKFSSGYVCLSNHLASQNYVNVYMGGASGAFAGKRNFYRSKGFDEILGLEELGNSDSDSPRSRWGIYDDELLPLIQQKIKILRSGDSPFALLALTLDSHPPEGFISPSCVKEGLRYGTGERPHFDALRCTDKLVGDFLEEVIQENIHDSTIVMLSDHTMMGSQAMEVLVEKKAPRHNHMVIWDKDLTPQRVHRLSSQFDVAATILQVLLGKSYKIGFGRSILDTPPNLTEQFGIKTLDESILAWRVKSWEKW